MKRMALSFVLKALTVCGLILSFFTPGYYGISFLFLYECPPLFAACLAGVSLLIGAFAYGVHLLLCKWEERTHAVPAIRKVLVGVLGIAVSVEVFWLFRDTLVFAILCAVLSGVLYFFSARLVYARYERLFTEVQLVSAALENLLILLIVYYVSKTYPIVLYDDLFIFTFLPAIFCFFISRNQGNIDYLMERRRHDLAHLPKKIRRYNVFLLCGLFVCLLVLFAFREPLIEFLWDVLRALRSVLYVIITFFLWLLSKLPGGRAVEEPADQEMGGMGEESIEAGIAIDWTILAVIGLALLFFVYRRQILSWLSDKWGLLCDLLHRLLFSSKERVQAVGHHSYYDDVVETLTQEERGFRRKNSVQTPRNWKREYRRYKKLSGEERVRFGFRLWMSWLTLQGEQVRPSATVSDILTLTEKYLKDDRKDDASHGYEKLRYSAQQFDEQSVASMDALLFELRQR